MRLSKAEIRTSVSISQKGRIRGLLSCLPLLGHKDEQRAEVRSREWLLSEHQPTNAASRSTCQTASKLISKSQEAPPHPTRCPNLVILLSKHRARSARRPPRNRRRASAIQYSRERAKTCLFDPRYLIALFKLSMVSESNANHPAVMRKTPR